MAKVNFLDFGNPISFFVGFYFLFLIAGIPILLGGGIFFVEFVITPPTYFIILLYIVVFLFGALILAPLFDIKKRSRVQRRMGLYYDLNVDLTIHVAFLFFLVGAFLMMLYYAAAGAIPALQPNVENARVALKVGNGKFVILGKAFLYVGLIFWAAYWGKLSLFRRVALIISTVIGVVLLAGTGFRGPPGFLVLSVVLMAYFGSAKYLMLRRLPWSYIFYGFVFFVILVIIGVARKNQTFNAGEALAVFHVVTVNISNLDRLVQAVPAKMDFFYGDTLLNDLSVLLPGSTAEAASLLLKNLLGLDFDGEGITITSPGEGYINFGWSGVIIHALFVGILCGFCYLKYGFDWRISRKVMLFLCAIGVSRMPQGGIGASILFTMAPLLVIGYFFTYTEKFLRFVVHPRLREYRSL